MKKIIIRMSVLSKLYPTPSHSGAAQGGFKSVQTPEVILKLFIKNLPDRCPKGITIPVIKC